eukprot:PRCOL_00000572-RA
MAKASGGWATPPCTAVHGAAAVPALGAVGNAGTSPATATRHATLVLLRHGESMYNKHGLFTGDVDVGLSEQGVYEALAGGRMFSHVNFDLILTSRLQRSRMTALLAMTQNDSGQVPLHVRGGLTGDVGPDPNRLALRDHALDALDSPECPTVPLYSEADLNERCYGHLQGMNKMRAVQTFGEEAVRKWRRSVDTQPPGGESMHDTALRAGAMFESAVLPRLAAGQNVLLVAHGNSLRSIIARVSGLTAEESIRLQVATASPIMYTYDGESFHNHTGEFNYPPKDPVTGEAFDKPQGLTSKLGQADSLV